MNESLWLNSTNPDDLLEFLLDVTSDRKLRLFACACCRELIHLVTEEHCLAALEAAEASADENIDANELHEAWFAAHQHKPIFRDANWAACWVAAPAVVQAVARTSLYVANYLAEIAAEEARNQARAAVCSGAPEDRTSQAWNDYHSFVEQATNQVREQQTHLLRDIVGNPYRPLQPDPAWRTQTVQSIARKIYSENRFEQVLILADALEEAGCQDETVLDHFRNGHKHVRGCHVVDAILGDWKEAGEMREASESKQNVKGERWKVES
ncbi:MAG: hypothetical protein ACFCD0_12520 [Gemmataceae bacterium]